MLKLLRLRDARVVDIGKGHGGVAVAAALDTENYEGNPSNRLGHTADGKHSDAPQN